MKEKICTLFCFIVCLLSVCACGRKAASDSTGDIQDSYKEEEIVQRVDKEEIKMSKNAEGEQSGHEKRSEGDSPKEISESMQ